MLYLSALNACCCSSFLLTSTCVPIPVWIYVYIFYVVFLPFSPQVLDESFSGAGERWKKQRSLRRSREGGAKEAEAGGKRRGGGEGNRRGAKEWETEPSTGGRSWEIVLGMEQEGHWSKNGRGSEEWKRGLGIRQGIWQQGTREI